MMHDEHHKSKTFRRDTFSRFAQKYDFKARLEPLDSYGLMPSDKLKEAKNFRVILTMGEKTMYFNISFPEYRRQHVPPIEDVLEYMANELATYESFGEDPQAFATFAKMSLEEAARHVYEASDAAKTIRVFLGPDRYRELLSISEQRGPTRPS
jgi:hypothetical protein